MVFDDLRELAVDADRLVCAIVMANEMVMREAAKYEQKCLEIAQKYDDERRDIPPLVRSVQAITDDEGGGKDV